jgi:uncharacterized membrane protein YqjE
MNLQAIFFGLGAIGSVSLIIQLFRPQYRAASTWLRTAFFSLATIAAVWSALGIFLAVRHSWLLDRIEAALTGLLVGIAISVATSPEYRRLHRSTP